jgi:hypothetical protein
MPPEVTEFIKTLPGWAQGVATIGFFIGTLLVAIIGFMRNKAPQDAKGKEVIVEQTSKPEGAPGSAKQQVEAAAIEYMILHDINETLKDGFKSLEDAYENKLDEHNAKMMELLKEVIKMMAAELQERNVEREVLKRIGHSLPPAYPQQQPQPYPPPAR